MTYQVVIPPEVKKLIENGSVLHVGERLNGKFFAAFAGSQTVEFGDTQDADGNFKIK